MDPAGSIELAMPAFLFETLVVIVVLFSKGDWCQVAGILDVEPSSEPPGEHPVDDPPFSEESNDQEVGGPRTKADRESDQYLRNSVVLEVNAREADAGRQACDNDDSENSLVSGETFPAEAVA